MSGGTGVKRFIEGQDRGQLTLLPECLDDYVGEDNPVRVVETFVDELDLAALGFAGVVPEATGRPSYHPATLLKIYLYGYLNRIASSRRLEREAQRNMELMWADRSADAGLQNNRRFSQGLWYGHSGNVPAICAALSASSTCSPTLLWGSTAASLKQ